MHQGMSTCIQTKQTEQHMTFHATLIIAVTMAPLKQSRGNNGSMTTRQPCEYRTFISQEIARSDVHPASIATALATSLPYTDTRRGQIGQDM